jgi:hypothetical protein
MAKKAQNGEINKSALIREMFSEKPEIKVKEIVAALKERGISVAPNLVYLVKGKLTGEKSRRRKVHNAAAKVATASGSSDALSTIHKVKKLAAEVAGLRTLKGLVDALSE